VSKGNGALLGLYSPAPYADTTIIKLVVMGVVAILFGASIIFYQKNAPVIVGITMIILGTGGVAYGVSLIPARNRGDI
jgi:hypothetical protein